MCALGPAFLLALPLLAGDGAPLAEAVRAFESDHPARRDAASRIVQELPQERLAPLIEALRSDDPEVRSRARQSLEAFLPARPSSAEEEEHQAGAIVLRGNRQNRVVVRLVQGNGQQLKNVNGRLVPDNAYERLKEFGADGEAAADPTLRRHLRLAAGRGFLVTDVKEDSRAWRLGLRAEDIVLRIDDAPVMTPEDVEGALGEEKEAWMKKTFRILRDGELKDLATK